MINESKIKEIEFEGTLKINDLSIPCFVLKDGTRILSGRGLQVG